MEQLLNIYSKNNDDVVLDPFMGTGTTAVACAKLNKSCIGFELSEAQVEYSLNRLRDANVDLMSNNKWSDLD